VTTVRRLYHLTRADFLERIRRSSFLIVLALTVWAGYLFVPPKGASYLVLFVGLKRGLYNSSWIGLMFGFIAASHLALLGFFLVKNAIGRDRRTGVGQIIATTPIRKPTYVVGKWLSNLAVLVSILVVMTAMAALMQLIRAEDLTVDLPALVMPIWLMGLPVLTIVAAMAVLFESIPCLSGGLGNVVYVMVWLWALAMVLAAGIDETTDLARPFGDLFGYTRQLADIQQQLLAGDPGASMSSGLLTPVRGRDIGTFVWDGFGWTARIVRERIMWSGLAVVLALISAVPFDRFDASRRRLGAGRKGRGERPISCLRMRPCGTTGSNLLDRKPSQGGEEAWPGAASLTPAGARTSRGRFFAVMVAELRLLLRGHSPVWYVGVLGLTIACLACPLDVVRQYLLPAGWLWPVLTWAQMGIRERRNGTEQLVFSAPNPVLRQLPAIWLSGVILAVLVGGGFAIRQLFVGNLAGTLGWLVGTLFVPSLALALGVWIGNDRGFELVYLLLWYVGVANGVPFFDYAGVTAEGLARGMPAGYLGVTVALLALAAVGRWRQMCH